MRRWVMGLSSIFAVFLVSGCWDQEKLVEKALIDGISIDQGKEKELYGTVRFLRLKNKGGGQFDAKDELIETEGDSVLEISQKLNMMMPGKIDASKTHIIIMGEELAKKDIYPLMEPLFRLKKAFLGAKIMVAKGQASNVLSIDKDVSPIAFDIIEMIDTGEVASVIPESTLFSIWSNMMDPGKDMMIPYIEKIQKEKIQLSGIALFNEGRYSGLFLNQKESTLLLILMDKVKVSNQIDTKIREKDKEDPISLNVTKVKRRTNIKVDKLNKQITYSINITMKAKLISYPQKNVKEIDISALDKKTSAQLTKEAKKIVAILQTANSDVLSIGRSVATQYPELWEKMKWKEEYQNVIIEPKLKVEIEHTGTIF